MQRRARRRRRQCAGHAAACAPARSTCWRSMCSARACGEPFLADELYDEVRAAAPYAGLTRADFDAVRRFRRHRRLCAEGLRALRQDPAGQGRPLAHRASHDRAALPHECRHHRRGRHAEGAAGALARLARLIPRGGRLLGEVEEYFIEMLTPGDTFVFAGEILQIRGDRRGRGLRLARARPRTRRCRPTRAASSRSRPISPTACARSSPTASSGAALPEQVREWLEIQEWRSLLPGPRDLLVETFPRANKYYLVCYPFEGRLAHQTLGMLLTRRLERARLRPHGLRRQRICAGDLGARRRGAAHRPRRAVARATVRRGHAGRRSRSLARGIRADEAHLPHLRHHRRA